MKQTVSKTIEKPKNRREGKARCIALSRNIYKLQNKNVYYVESETCDNRYYFVRYNICSPQSGFCSCRDYESNRAEQCKHMYSVFYGIGYNTVKEVEHFPEVLKKKKDLVADKYKNESIRTLNDLEKAEIEAEEYRTQRILSYESDQYDF